MKQVLLLDRTQASVTSPPEFETALEKSLLTLLGVKISHLEGWSRTISRGLPGDLADLSVVHGAEDRGIAHPLADPQLDADAGVEEEHGGEGQQEEGHHDEGGVGLPV